MTGTWESGLRRPARLHALHRSGLVGTSADDAFDRLIELACSLTGAPRGCLTLVDAERTTAMSSFGFPADTDLFAPVEHSFCRFVVGTGRPLVVGDARTDPRTSGDPAIEAFHAAAWAGFPLEDADGMVLGTLCVMDHQPHDWTDSDLHLLATLAVAASTQIAFYRLVAEANRRTARERRVAAAADDQLVQLLDRLDGLVARGELSTRGAAELRAGAGRHHRIGHGSGWTVPRRFER